MMWRLADSFSLTVNLCHVHYASIFAKLNDGDTSGFVRLLYFGKNKIFLDFYF